MLKELIYCIASRMLDVLQDTSTLCFRPSVTVSDTPEKIHFTTCMSVFLGNQGDTSLKHKQLISLRGTRQEHGLFHSITHLAAAARSDNKTRRPVVDCCYWNLFFFVAQKMVHLVILL